MYIALHMCVGAVISKQFKMDFLCITVFLTLLVLVSSANEESCTTPEKTSGKCIQLRYCPPLLSIVIKKPISQPNLDYLKLVNCGFVGIHPKVCCPCDDCLKTPEVDPVPVNPTNNNNGSILPNVNECGFPYEDIIYNGIETPLDTFAWTVLLQYNTPKGLQFHCGGVLISRRYVLTAANCVSPKSIDRSWNLRSVRLGEHDLSRNPDFENLDCEVYYAEPAVEVSIEKVIVHPLYNTETLAHDIALLRLVEDITFSDHISPICLETPAESIHLISRNSATACGWNANKENEPRENIKKKTLMKIEDNAKCGSRFVDNGIQLTDQLCATPTQDSYTYYGDTGGALQGFTTRRQYYVIGVMSFRSINSSSNNKAVIYSNVKEHISWIIETLEP